MRLRAFSRHSIAFAICICIACSAFGQSAVNGSASGSTLAYGVQGSVSDTNAAGSAGVHGVGGTASTYGVFGEAGGNVLSVGVCGQGPEGVRGVNSTIPSVDYLVAGVVGQGLNNPGVTGQSGYAGINGRLYSTTTGSFLAEGDLGAIFNPGGFIYGVYAQGNTGATGVKSFVEPHPTDPSKTIKFVSLEGNEAGTYFRGRGRFVDGKATIRVPEEFRLVTEEDGLTVNVTPMGRIASVGVISADLNEIVVESTRDVDFSFIVYGVRHGYKDFQPITEGGEFVPRGPDERIPAYLNASQKERLIANGTYNADGTVNLHTALKLGWDKAWAERQSNLTK
jgi:hypothetical protein